MKLHFLLRKGKGRWNLLWECPSANTIKLLQQYHFPLFHFLYNNFSLFDYLYGFISRTKPLMNLDQQLIEIEQVPRVIINHFTVISVVSWEPYHDTPRSQISAIDDMMWCVMFSRISTPSLSAASARAGRGSRRGPWRTPGRTSTSPHSQHRRWDMKQVMCIH